MCLPLESDLCMKQLDRKRYKKSCPFFHNVVPYAMQIDCHLQQTECQIWLFDSKYMYCRWSRLTWPILCFVVIRQIRHSNLISKIVYIWWCVLCTVWIDLNDIRDDLFVNRSIAQFLQQIFLVCLSNAFFLLQHGFIFWGGCEFCSKINLSLEFFWMEFVMRIYYENLLWKILLKNLLWHYQIFQK